MEHCSGSITLQFYHNRKLICCTTPCKFLFFGRYFLVQLFNLLQLKRKPDWRTDSIENGSMQPSTMSYLWRPFLYRRLNIPEKFPKYLKYLNIQVNHTVQDLDFEWYDVLLIQSKRKKTRCAYCLGLGSNPGYSGVAAKCANHYNMPYPHLQLDQPSRSRFTAYLTIKY